MNIEVQVGASFCSRHSGGDKRQQSTRPDVARVEFPSEIAHVVPDGRGNKGAQLVFCNLLELPNGVQFLLEFSDNTKVLLPEMLQKGYGSTSYELTAYIPPIRKGFQDILSFLHQLRHFGNQCLKWSKLACNSCSKSRELFEEPFLLVCNFQCFLVHWLLLHRMRCCRRRHRCRGFVFSPRCVAKRKWKTRKRKKSKKE